MQIALSSFYETNQDADMDLVNAADTIDDGDDDGDDESNVAVGGSASSSFPAHFVTDKKEKKQKSKNRAVGGGRIFTLNNMSSSEDDDDDNTGQVSVICMAKTYELNTDGSNIVYLGFLCWWIRAIRSTSIGSTAKKCIERFCLKYF